MVRARSPGIAPARDQPVFARGVAEQAARAVSAPIDLFEQLVALARVVGPQLVDFLFELGVAFPLALGRVALEDP